MRRWQGGEIPIGDLRQDFLLFAVAREDATIQERCMETKRYKPKFDKLFYIPIVIVSALMVGATAVSVIEPAGLVIMLACDLIVLYFVLSCFAGYVELRESVMFVKFGFFLKREIPYSKIRKIERQHRLYSESMLSLKNSLDHIDVRYNLYDVVSISVIDNDDFVRELCLRAGVSRSD